MARRSHLAPHSSHTTLRPHQDEQQEEDEDGQQEASQCQFHGLLGLGHSSLIHVWYLRW